MRAEILYRPAFAAARVCLEPGESIRAESGSMIAMSPTITIESGMVGGITKAIGRLLGGESAFQTTFTAMQGSGEVLLAPVAVGDIATVRLFGDAFMVANGAFLAGDASLTVHSRTSLKGFLAGEGLYLLRVSGTGTLLVSAFGAIHALELGVGQTYIVDTGHVVAFSDTMDLKIRKAARTVLGSMTSGEGVVAEFTGPGMIYMQTRSLQAFGTYLKPFLPKTK